MIVEAKTDCICRITMVKQILNIHWYANIVLTFTLLCKLLFFFFNLEWTYSVYLGMDGSQISILSHGVFGQHLSK